MQETNIYSKSFTELVETFNQFSEQEIGLLPKELLLNMKKNMDPNYIWEFDRNKNIKDQNYMTETKALIVNLYKKYLCPEEEKEKWKKYDKICTNLIEDEKRKKYNPDEIFVQRLKNTQVKEILDNNSEKLLLAEIKEESKFQKLLKKISVFLQQFIKH